MDVWDVDRISRLLQELKVADAREATHLAGWVWEEIFCFGKMERRELGANEIQRLESVMLRIKAGEPIQYIAQHAWFYGHKFLVTPDVLIPRPETEELAEWIYLDWKYAAQPVRILDIGTGSGCIAIMLQKLLGPNAVVVAIDISEEALAVARRNSDLLNAPVTFLHHDFLQKGFAGLGEFDVIASNPPYISSESFSDELQSGLRYEPRQALFPEGDDPDIFYRKIIAEGMYALKNGGGLYLELNEFRTREIREIASIHHQVTWEIRQDLQQKDRMLRVTKRF